MLRGGRLSSAGAVTGLIEVKTNCLVERVLIENGRAVGVAYGRADVSSRRDARAKCYSPPAPSPRPRL